MAETDFKYDVFVSYSSANKDWVRKTFVPILEIAGLKVCDYYRDFDVGASIVKEMERAVLESSKTIPVLSPAYLNSGWTEFESLMLQTLDAANRERKLLPVMIESCELPLRIKYMNCINFANPDDVEIEWQRLSRALGVTLSPIINPKSSTIPNWYLAHPYPMPPNFTGRAIELKMLDDWLADQENRLFILSALGGFGKSALAWQWINTHVNPAEWTKLVFWSFYEGDASFEHFVEETLRYLKLNVPQGQRPQVDELLKAMQGQKILLIIDGFERALRAYSSMNAAYQGDEEPKLEDSQYDCVNINAQIFLQKVCSLPNMTSTVLMTTRLTPRAVKTHDEFLQGCIETELKEMDKADAVAFFHAQGIQGNRTEIEAACAPYGYHPLSLRLLAGRILKDFENPADIAVAQKIKIDGDIKQYQHHVLEVSYNSLPPNEQKLLSTIACFRSPVTLDTLVAISKPTKAKGVFSAFQKTTNIYTDNLGSDLQDLIERGLLHFDEKNKKFDLHPIVRRFAYERLTTPDRTASHIRLSDYFASIDIPRYPQTLDDLAPVIELYHHIVHTGKLDDARELYRDYISNAAYYQFGAYQMCIELLQSLFIDGEGKPPRLKEELAQAWTLNSLANSYSQSGQPHLAVQLFELSIALDEKHKDKENLATDLANLATMAQLSIGALHACESNLRCAIELNRELDIEKENGNVHYQLGEVLFYLGRWKESEEELLRGIDLEEKDNQLQGQGVAWGHRSLRALLITRDLSQPKIKNLNSAIAFAQRALKLAEEDSQTFAPLESDFVRAHWLLGATYRLKGQLDLAEHRLSEALTRCRAINLLRREANILLDLARLRYDQKKYNEAKSLAEEALTITERCGYVLQGADVNLFLAQYALEQEKDKVKAKEYAETALKLAYCDGPPYYYKVAYDEAVAMLERLKV